MMIENIFANTWVVTIGGGLIVLIIWARVKHKIIPPPIEKREEINRKLSELLKLAEEALFNPSIKFKDVKNNQKIFFEKVTEIRDLAMVYKIGSKKKWCYLMNKILENFDKREELFDSLPFNNTSIFLDIINDHSIEDICNNLNKIRNDSSGKSYDLNEADMSNINSIMENIDPKQSPFINQTEKIVESISELNESLNHIILDFKNSVSNNKHY